MKFTWAVNGAFVLALTYPVSLLVAPHREAVSDSVLALICITIPVLMVIGISTKKLAKQPVKLWGLNAVMFGDIFLSDLIKSPRAFGTSLAGVAVATQIIALTTLLLRKRRREMKPEAL